MLAGILILAFSIISFAAEPEDKGSFKITETTSVGDVLKRLHPDTYNAASDAAKKFYNTTLVFDLGKQEKTSAIYYSTLYAGLSSNVESPAANQLNYSATIEANMACPSMTLSSIAYDESGDVVSSVSNMSAGKTKVSVADIVGGLTSGEKVTISFAGVVEPPAGFEPGPGALSSAKMLLLSKLVVIQNTFKNI